jgi:hypothetical protein
MDERTKRLRVLILLGRISTNHSDDPRDDAARCMDLLADLFGREAVTEASQLVSEHGSAEALERLV